ncbi:hypothetical protein GCM10010918_01410 [Paenibacillus radicis (ex Gao et al. 2016)]|uniref:Uncharacterized protein n=1 Tax=Paenibacillus radicis (ex Gao et al. 2016) TaxID=1737354 RepID=A0A917GNM2_9BACL|nr:hypothetical protein GCM10010918_01410 [Paenibacillus radicis (ex Gao et al. 2016)]
MCDRAPRAAMAPRAGGARGAEKVYFAATCCEQTAISEADSLYNEANFAVESH